MWPITHLAWRSVDTTEVGGEGGGRGGCGTRTGVNPPRVNV